MELKPCPVCGEDTIIARPGYVIGRACACERTRQVQAKADRAKPRCEAVISDRGAFEEKCGDHEGHEGKHGQKLVRQVRKGRERG